MILVVEGKSNIFINQSMIGFLILFEDGNWGKIMTMRVKCSGEKLINKKTS
jgi:hypothetical protein